MNKGRIEAFSDGVIAIIITIMVLELKTPHGTTLAALTPLIPKLLSYLLSFIYVGIYWNNHHHLFHAVHQIRGAALWANLHLLFWMSVIPFVTGWMGENHFSEWPVIVYGLILALNGFAFTLLAWVLVKEAGPGSTLAKALGKDWKSRASTLVYLLAIGLAFVNPAISLTLYTMVAIIWFIPDRRIERALLNETKD
ncbi:TMEM175 family protein [Mucilaginibacter terrae]|uniref:Membrane protein n=1 Tax=Mucilaginibacter terrae TaxID=1955052 RepID=A0ABU3GUB7_9SPHI|nr:TMEM175 family protein [Mucilaginibacter terrae]MDT3403166.1 putative membrane protein [Mucilaginibacter terrae]